MARPFTTGQRTTTAGPSLWIHAWLYILDSDGNWRDVTSMSGYDWFNGAQWGEDIDNQVAQGTITLRRQVGPASANLSLAPTMSASGLNKNMAGAYSPLLTPGSEFKLIVATVPYGTAKASVASGDMFEVWRGKVDSVNWEADPIVLNCRDDGGWYQNMFIKNLVNYGTLAGIPMETVMDQIIADNPPKINSPIFEPTVGGVLQTTNYNVIAYTQQRESVMQALNDLALNIGWDIRFRYDVDGISKLTLLNPPRDKTIPDYTMGPDEYFAVKNLQIADTNVRNYVRIVYADSTTGGIGEVVSTNDASILAYGERFYELVSSAAQNVSTEADAQVLADAIVNDLGAPQADQEITTFFCYILQLYDLIAFTANGKNYDEDQAFGVISYQHTLANHSGKTDIKTRGQLAGAYKKWITRFGLNTVSLFGAPTPSFSVTATGSPDGGVTQDATVSVAVGFEPNTLGVYIYSETAATQPPVPDESLNTLNYYIVRPAGQATANPYYQVTVDIDTTNGYWRTLKCFGIGPDGQRSTPYIISIQAGTPNAAAVELPGFQDFTVNRDGTTAVLGWAIDLTAAPLTAVIVVTRNGQAISGSGISQGTESFIDPQPPTDSDTIYTVYLYDPSTGNQGPASTATLPASSNPLNAATAPVFNNGTPGLVNYQTNYSGTLPNPPSSGLYVVLGWTCADTGADQIQVQWSGDQQTWDTVYDSGTGAGVSAIIAAGTAWSTETGRGYFRLVTFLAGTVRQISGIYQLIPTASGTGGITIFAVQPATAQIAGSGGSISPFIVIQWINNDTGAANTIVQKANALGGPWTTVATQAGGGNGTFEDNPDYADPLYFRVATLATGGATRFIATAITWYPLPYEGFSAGTYSP